MDKLDLSLDDISSRNGGGRGGGRRGGGGGRGRGRRRNSFAGGPPPEVEHPLDPRGGSNPANGPIRNNNPNFGGGFQGRRRAGPYDRPSRSDNKWTHDKFADGGAFGFGGGGGVQAVGGVVAPNPVVVVSNLDPDVESGDLVDIFKEMAPVQNAVIHYDRDGRSLGTAQVTFKRREDAERAVHEYDGAEVDGRPMYLKVLGSLVKQRTIRKPQNEFVGGGGGFFNGGGFGGRRGAFFGRNFQSRRGRGGFFQRGGGGKGRRGSVGRGGGARGGRGGGRGKGRGGNKAGGKGKGGKAKPRTAEDLDAELDNYHKGGGEDDGVGGGGGQPPPIAKAPAAAAE